MCVIYVCSMLLASSVSDEIFFCQAPIDISIPRP
jgi:hypothetical protein